MTVVEYHKNSHACITKFYLECSNISSPKILRNLSSLATPLFGGDDQFFSNSIDIREILLSTWIFHCELGFHVHENYSLYLLANFVNNGLNSPQSQSGMKFHMVGMPPRGKEE